MNALALSAIIFVLSLGGIFLGTQLRRALPEHHLDEHAKDVVRLGVGLIATIAALVLELLIAAAKASFDTQSTHLKHITANLILLDNSMAQRLVRFVNKCAARSVRLQTGSGARRRQADPLRSACSLLPAYPSRIGIFGR